MVALQILALSVRVRILPGQQYTTNNNNNNNWIFHKTEKRKCDIYESQIIFWIRNLRGDIVKYLFFFYLRASAIIRLNCKMAG